MRPLELMKNLHSKRKETVKAIPCGIFSILFPLIKFDLLAMSLKINFFIKKYFVRSKCIIFASIISIKEKTLWFIVWT